MVSVIIPCYNSGAELYEALNSLNRINVEIEVVVVDDGSTNEYTLKILDNIREKGIKVLKKSNGGPGDARNLGVKNSTGEFLFFLDSDNRVSDRYFDLALEVFQTFPKVGVVYGKPNFFSENGSVSTRFETKPFSYDSLMCGNYIDACCFVRRSTFEEVGGFHVHPHLKGWDDADLWIRISHTRWEFHFLDEVLFDYRVREDSMMGLVDDENIENMLQYFGKKYGYYYHKKYRQYFRVIDQIQKNPFLWFLRILYYKYIKRTPLIK